MGEDVDHLWDKVWFWHPCGLQFLQKLRVALIFLWYLFWLGWSCKLDCYLCFHGFSALLYLRKVSFRDSPVLYFSFLFNGSLFLIQKGKKKVTINAYKKIYKRPPLKAPTNKARPDLEAHSMTKYFHECIYDLSHTVSWYNFTAENKLLVVKFHQICWGWKSH